jgi:hypothetical protein
MHDIEPYYKWRDYYIASEDERSPFYGRSYSEFTFSNRVYNYMIHPQWDEFGSHTLYSKILYAQYDLGFAIIELIGEWNDCITNDIMYLKRNIVDRLQKEGIRKFILICENVLNFHGDEDVYYEEWWEEAMDEGGWVVMLNLLDHVEREMVETQLDNYLYLGEEFNDFSWRKWLPPLLLPKIEDMIDQREKRIT